MTTALVPIGEIERMAQAVAASKLFGMQTVEQAMALMLVAQAEGLHPATAARDYHVIQGRPALKADAMLARFQERGGVVEWQDYTDTKVAGLFSHPVNSPKPVRIEWTMEQAKRAWLTGKDNWTKYPRAMLRARVISEGVRTVFPAVSVGIYTPEEVQDFKDVNPPPAEKGHRRRKPAEDVVDVDDEKLKDVESRAAGGTTQAGEHPPSGAASAPETRTQALKRLCQAAYGDNWDVQEVKILDKAGVRSAEEISEQDWREAKAMLERKITRRAELGGQA